MNKIIVLIERDKNGYGAFSANTRSTIIGAGSTVEETKADFINSYNEVIETFTGNGLNVPEELTDPVFEYTYDISALFDAFKFLNASKFAESIGISPSLMRHYKSGDTYISAKQAKKIEAGLHRLARELLAVSL
ncbi:MAG: helix-turn-helix transcriptional regulator [Bacteroidales bacterium]|nr:helix-turn-helix transcriptional regulator [Bacteroidales bacterium]